MDWAESCDPGHPALGAGREELGGGGRDHDAEARQHLAHLVGGQVEGLLADLVEHPVGPQARQGQGQARAGGEDDVDRRRETLEQIAERTHRRPRRLAVVDDEDEALLGPGEIVGDGDGDRCQVGGRLVQTVEGLGPEVGPAETEGVDQGAPEGLRDTVTAVAAHPDDGHTGPAGQPIDDQRGLARRRKPDDQGHRPLQTLIELVEQ